LRTSTLMSCLPREPMTPIREPRSWSACKFFLPCCGSGSGAFIFYFELFSSEMNVLVQIRIRILPLALTMPKIHCSGSEIPDEQHRSYFLELVNHYFGLKYWNSLMLKRDPWWKIVWSRKRSRLRNTGFGSGSVLVSSLNLWIRIRKKWIRIRNTGASL
jgi:hypothetical protein